MAREVVWSIRAQKDRRQILAYWRNRNKSDLYSRKLNHLFRESIKLIADYPQIGKQTDDPKVRVKIVRDYLIIYEVIDNQIHILTIWDHRQDPDNLRASESSR